MMKLLYIIAYYFRELLFKVRFYICSPVIQILRLVGHSSVIFLEQPIDLDKIKNILILRTDRLGDLILTTPAIETLLDYFTWAKIDILVTSYTKPIVEQNSRFNQIIEKDQYSQSKLNSLLRDNKYDLAVIFFPHISEKRIAFNAGIPYRLGTNRDGGGFLLTHHHNDKRASKLLHEAQACLDLVSLLRISAPWRPLFVPIPKEPSNLVTAFLKQQHQTGKELIILHPFSRDPKMRWPMKSYLALSDKLVSLGTHTMILIGGINEKVEANDFISSLKSPIVNMTGQFSLQDLMVLFAHSRLFIGNSTGTMHLANAVGTPVIAIYGSHYVRHHVKRWCPWNRGGLAIVSKNECGICVPNACRMECMEKITVEQVFEEVNKVLTET